MSFDIALEPYYYPIVFTLHLDIRLRINWSTDLIRLAHTSRPYDRRSIIYSRKSERFTRLSYAVLAVLPSNYRTTQLHPLRLSSFNEGSSSKVWVLYANPEPRLRHGWSGDAVRTHCITSGLLSHSQARSIPKAFHVCMHTHICSTLK